MKALKSANKKVFFVSLIALNSILALYSVSALAHTEDLTVGTLSEVQAHELDMFEDDFELLPEFEFYEKRGCQKASSSQVNVVNSGNAKRSEFQNRCIASTNSTNLCEQVERPNPSSKTTFFCTYGLEQPHRLIHPEAKTWDNAIKAVQFVQLLTEKGICISHIYNWWRPEPYNANVGGAAGRHPFGTSVDVRFCTNKDATRGFDELCKYRKKGEIRALGYYGSTGVHIGVGDKSATTWGRNCK